MHFNTQLFIGLPGCLGALVPLLAAAVAVVVLFGPFLAIVALVVSKLNRRFKPDKYLDYSNTFVNSTGLANTITFENRFFKAKAERREKKSSVYNSVLFVIVVLITIWLVYKGISLLLNIGIIPDSGFGFLLVFLIAFVILLCVCFVVSLAGCLLAMSIILKLFNSIKARFMRRRSTAKIQTKRDLNEE